MSKQSILALTIGSLLFLSGSCSPRTTSPSVSAEVDISNPASEYCLQQGNILEIITAEDGSQSGLCVFPDGGSCDEWAYFRGECDLESPQVSSNDIGEVVPAQSFESVDYQGWWRYTHSVYGFSIMLPEDWIVEEVTASDPLMNGHMLMLHPRYTTQNESIRMAFRRSGEDTLIWPTGVGHGEFVPDGTLEIAGEDALRNLLVCPTGETTSIWYHQLEGTANVTRADLEFAFIFNAGPSHCESGYSLDGKVQYLGEMIISSLMVPD